jgi:chaperonin GroES
MPTSAQKRARKQLQAVVPVVPVPKIPKKYRTLNDQFLIKRLDMDDEKTAGGLIKPEIARQRSQRGEVRWCNKNETECPIGTIVIFTKYGGSDIEINGEKLVIVHRKQLYAIEEDLEGPMPAA